MVRRFKWPGETTLMSEADHTFPLSVAPQRDDLVIKAVIVQGGEADIGGEKTAFARIVMSGIAVRHTQVEYQAPRRQETVVLRLDAAAALAASLKEVVDRIVRSTPTPAVPASGAWSWTSAPPLDEDLLSLRREPKEQPTRRSPGWRRPCGWTSPAHGYGTVDRRPSGPRAGAIFSGARQAQALVSS